MSRPLVSCVVPVFNCARFLPEAVESILAQRYGPFEIIVVDDGSTDATEEVAKGFGDRIRYVRQETLGPPATRNTGVRLARGEFLAFLDGDDVWLPQKLERQMAQFEQKPDLDVSVTLIQNFWSEELAEESARLREHRRAKPLPGYISGTMLTKLALFKQIGLFDTRYFFADAAEWFLRARRRQTVIELLHEVLVKHRMHPKNLTRRRAGASKAEFLAVTRANLKFTRGSRVK